MKIWNNEKLREDDIRREFQKIVETKLQGTDWQEEEDTDKLWNILKQGVCESAKKILGEKETKHQDQWFDQ